MENYSQKHPIISLNILSHNCWTYKANCMIAILISCTAVDGWMFPLLQSSNEDLFKVKVTLTEGTYREELHQAKSANPLFWWHPWSSLCEQSCLAYPYIVDKARELKVVERREDIKKYLAGFGPRPVSILVVSRDLMADHSVMTLNHMSPQFFVLLKSLEMGSTHLFLATLAV